MYEVYEIIPPRFEGAPGKLKAIGMKLDHPLANGNFIQTDMDDNDEYQVYVVDQVAYSALHQKYMVLCLKMQGINLDMEHLQ